MKTTCVYILLFLFYLPLYAQNDCPEAITVCGNANYFDLDATGPGDIAEVAFGNACSSGENNTVWLKVIIDDGGTLNFTIIPTTEDLVIDFDFWLYGPDVECDDLGTAIRCSTTNPLQAGLDYNTTGMNDIETDVSEGPGSDGNSFINGIEVQTGETYYLIVDRPHGFGNFSVDWSASTATFHELPEFLNPDDIPLDMILCDSDGQDDQSTAFDLTVYEEMFIGEQDDVIITYHENLNDSTLGEDPIEAPQEYQNASSPQTIYLRMTNSITGCYSNHTFNIEVYPRLNAGEPVDLLVCDDAETGVFTFDLSENDNFVKNGNPLTFVSYYTSLSNAQNGIDPVGPLFTNEVPYENQTIWARLEDANDCFSYDFFSFDLIVLPLPQFNNPDNISLNLAQCDNDGVNDQTSIFDLTQHEDMLVGNQDNIFISYHISPEDAEEGENPIDGPEAYQNTSNPQTIYIYMLDFSVGCYNVMPFELTVTGIEAGTPQDLVLCDTEETGFREFDLSQSEAALVDGVDGIVVTYHLSEEDAENDENAIGPLYTNAVAYETQTIWARLEKNNGECMGLDFASFDITVEPLPYFNNPANISLDLYACDEDGIDDQSTPFDLTTHANMLTGGQDNVVITYYETAEAAEIGEGWIMNTGSYPNTSNPQTIYMRITNMLLGCYRVTSFTLNILPVPDAPEQPALEECDFNNDHFAAFDLESVLQQIEAEMGNMDATIHETLDDAIFDANAIINTTAYDNIAADTQTLYIRVESALTGCFDIVTLQLIVNPVPEAVTPGVYAICDNGGNDNDGEAIFDLTTLEEEILGGMSPADYTVTFHINPQQAAEGTGPITAPASYLSPSATIYARVTNNDTGCYDVVEVTLVVDALPDVTDPTPITLCDDDIQDPEQEIFDLTAKIPEIIGEQEGLLVTFHLDYDTAVANEDAIENPYEYVNAPPVETIFVRVTNVETGCYRIVLLDVRVEPLPIILEPTLDDLTVCDTNGMGIGEFDLESLVEGMINNGDNLSITFHETIQDAQDGINEITNTETYHNLTPYEQDIAVRVTNTVTGCFNTYLLTLHVEDAPQAPDLEDITQCDDTDNNGQDDQMFFNLTIQDQVVYDALGLDETEQDQVIIHYFIDEDWAYAGAPRITVPENYYGSANQEIWVRVEDATSECFSVSSFFLRIDQPHLPVQPAPYTLCNTELPNTPATETFDLTTRDEEILGEFGIGQGYTVTYYESQADVDNNTPIANPEAYTNPAGQNPKTIFVVVTTEEGCRSYTTLTIRVLPLPVPDTTPDPLVLCDANNPGDGVEVFNLTDAEEDIRNNDFQSVVTYHTTLENAENDIQDIPNPEAFSSPSATIWVRMEANTTNPNDPVCYQVVELQLIVTPLPSADDLVYAQCQKQTAGVMTFNLLDFVENLIGPTAEDYDITFYFDQAAYDAGTALPVVYDNQVPFNQTILVHIENLVTDCEVLMPMQLIVEEAATAYPVSAGFNPMIECDYDGNNDGFTEFDLTQVAPDVLGPQNPADYTVTYHESEADAIAGENAIDTPEAYQNLTQTQTIWVRVTHTNSISQCWEVTSFQIEVELLAEPVISSDEGNTICVDFNTQEVLRSVTLDSGITPNGHTFDWYLDGELIASNGDGTYEATAPGMYTVQVTSANGCESEMSAAFEVIQSGPASAIGTGYYVTDAFSDNAVITVLVEGYGQYEFRLDDGPWQSSNVFNNVSPGTHLVTVRDVLTEFSCGELPLIVNVIDYMNFFTPNGDGIRDYWNIIGLENQPDADVYIFDRHGKLIKQISTAGKGWDGTYNGEPLPSSDYWFTVTYGEYVGDVLVQKTFRAHFSLKR